MLVFEVRNQLLLPLQLVQVFSPPELIGPLFTLHMVFLEFILQGGARFLVLPLDHVVAATLSRILDDSDDHVCKYIAHVDTKDQDRRVAQCEVVLDADYVEDEEKVGCRQEHHLSQIEESRLRLFLVRFDHVRSNHHSERQPKDNQ